MTLKQVCKRLGRSANTVRQMVRDGKLSRPRLGAGNRPIWFERDLEVYEYRLGRGDFEPGDPLAGFPKPKPGDEDDEDDEDEP